MKPSYQAPSLSGVYMPPVMASFHQGHYQKNGLRGLGESAPLERKQVHWGLVFGVAVGVAGLALLLRK